MNPSTILAAITIAMTPLLAPAAPVPSSFTYQGTLEDDGQPVNSTADFSIALYNGASLVGATSQFNQPVVDGQFSIELDFNPTLFDGTPYEIEISVRSPSGAGVFETLSPRQSLTTTPYAYHANTADTLATPASIVGISPTNLVTINQLNSSSDISALRVTRGVASEDLTLFQDRVAEFQSDDTDIGVLGLSSRFPIVGYLGEDSVGPNAAAVIGQVGFNAAQNQYAIWALNQPAVTEARLATDDYAADLLGDVRITGEITKSYSFGSFNYATPMAYGFINSNGTVAHATPNFTADWNSLLSRYEISFDNTFYFFNEFVTIVTASSFDVAPYTTSSSGRLIIYFRNINSGASQQANFQFITYKNNGPAAVQGQQRPPLVPLTTTITDEQLYPNLAPPAPRTPIINEPTKESPLHID